MFNIGDKFLCKRDCYYKKYKYFKKNKYYTIKSFENNSHFNIECEIYPLTTFMINKKSIATFKEIFYSKQEERKIKLEKLDGI